MVFAARKHREPEAVGTRPSDLRPQSAQTATAAPEAAYHLRLYVAGTLPNSVQALGNLLEICRTHLAGRHKLEVVDYLEHPRRALEDRIVATPTLLKVAPGPACMVVGTLSDREMVLQALGISEDR